MRITIKKRSNIQIIMLQNKIFHIISLHTSYKSLNASNGPLNASNGSLNASDIPLNTSDDSLHISSNPLFCVNLLKNGSFFCKIS